jgi:hypothetical protein
MAVVTLALLSGVKGVVDDMDAAEREADHL